MRSSVLITLEIGLVLGVVVVLGGWELWRLRREQARDRENAQLNAPFNEQLGPRAGASEKAAGTEPSER